MGSNELLDSVNRQIALVGAEVRDGSVVGQTEPFPQAFITAEKEQFVFLDRPAQNTAGNQTVLGAVVICGDREFANGINSQIGSRRAARRLARIVTHILSIHEERILSGLRSANAHFQAMPV